MTSAKRLNIFNIFIVLGFFLLIQMDSFASGEDLLDAASRGNFQKVISLIESGEDINFSPASADSEQLSSPLTVAIAKKHLNIAKALIEKGADVNQFGYANGTPLMHAALIGDSELLLDLTRRGASVNARNPGLYNGSTALHWAVSGGSSEVLSILLKNGAEVATQDDKGQTALMKAIEGQQLDMVRILLKNKADPKQARVWSSTLNRFGTPLSNALQLLKVLDYQKVPTQDLSRIIIFMAYPVFLKLEIKLEEQGYSTEAASGLMESLLDKTYLDFVGPHQPKVRNLQFLCMKALLEAKNKLPSEKSIPPNPNF